MQKVVQLPFQIPAWKEKDISRSISKIVSEQLTSDLAAEFEKSKNLIMKAVQSNPRQLKRFINNIILAKLVFDKPSVKELIVVQALNFNPDWNDFLERITPDKARRTALIEYMKFKEDGRQITNKEELDEFNRELSVVYLLRYHLIENYLLRYQSFICSNDTF